MLNFLKRIGGIKDIGTDRVHFSGVELWLDKKLKETTLSQELTECFDDISNSLLVLDSNLKSLAAKKLEDEVPPEHIDVINENRDGYLGIMRNFMKNIVIEKKDVDSIIKYGSDLDEALIELKEDTKNTISIMNKFFPDEINEINETIEGIAETKEILDDLINRETGVKFVQDVKKIIHTIKKKNKDVLQVQNEMQKELQKLKQAEEHKLKIETEFDNLKTSDEFTKFDSILAKKIKLEKELERENENMLALFHPLSKMLSKFAETESEFGNVSARHYSKDPLLALQADRGNWIFNFIALLSKNINDMEPDEKKRIKLMNAASSLSPNAVDSYLTKIGIIREALSQTQKQTIRNSATLKMEDLKYKLNHVIEQTRIILENKQKYEDAISALNSEKDLLMLERKLNLLSRVKLE